MRERLSGVWITVRERWSNTTRQLRILLLGGAAIVFAAAIVIVLILNHTEYVVLYNNMTVSQNAEVLAQLQEIGVQGQIRGTAILIPAQHENAVRMHLAVRGQPQGDGFGYDIFAMAGGLTATQADREFYATAQAQARLSAMIMTIPEIREAWVTINFQDTTSFIFAADRLPASVAVVIERMPGRNLRPEQVQGILNIVMASVQGVHEDNVQIMDSVDGDLRLMLLGGGAADRHAQALRLTEMVNETFRRRILQLLVPVYGDDGVEVRVNSVLDTAERTTERIDYIPFDPLDPTNNPLDYRETEWERTVLGGPAQGVPGATDNIDVPMYLAEVDDGTGIHAFGRRVEDFLVSSERNMIIDAGLEIVNMSVAVIIDAEELTPGVRDQVTNLVAMASGVLPEGIAVHGLPFVRPPVEEPFDPTTIFRSPIFWIIVSVLFLLLAGLAIFFLVIKRRKKVEVIEAIDLEEQASLMDLMAAQDDFEPIQLPETQESKLKSQIKDLADTDPEIVAQLIKTWLLSAT